MRVGIQGWGSEGDLRPLIALGARLRLEGHAPNIVLTPIDVRDYREECRALDVPLLVVPEQIGFSIEALAEGARAARIHLQTKRNGDEGSDGHLYFLPWAPHRPLLAACSVAVHHGGAGTTHAALRAGRPSVVLPFIFEQTLWTNRLQAVGVAPSTPRSCSNFPAPRKDRGNPVRNAMRGSRPAPER